MKLKFIAKKKLKPVEVKMLRELFRPKKRRQLSRSFVGLTKLQITMRPRIEALNEKALEVINELDAIAWEAFEKKDFAYRAILGNSADMVRLAMRHTWTRLA